MWKRLRVVGLFPWLFARGFWSALKRIFSPPARFFGRVFGRIGGFLVVPLKPFWWLFVRFGVVLAWLGTFIWKNIIGAIVRRLGLLLSWPFRLRGIARERWVLTFVFIAALASAAIAYPPLWDRPQAVLKPRVEAWGNWAAVRFDQDRFKWAGERLSPEALPEFFAGRSLSEYALGLDLIGGAHLEYSIDTSKLSSSDVEEATGALRDTIERRVNIFGVREPLVQLAKSGDEHRLIVELAGVPDIAEAVKRVGDPIFLEFREEVDIPTTGPNGEPLDLSQLQIDPFELFKPAAEPLTGQYLQRADVVFDPTTNAPQVQLTFNEEGAKRFQEITKNNVGKRVAIFLDEYPVTTPVVQQEISGGTAVITGSFTLEEAKALARNLNAGALPVPITLVAQRTIGATLGEESLQQMIRAGLATMAIIATFMVLLYRLPGLLALVALGFYAVLLLALFKLVPITMTLAGIAGLILSIGMAVDANILIFARMREERRQGRDPRTALEEGFRRAWLAIRDSNVATLLTTGILYAVGTSFVQGFALALGIGVLLSMFTAVFISRYLMREAIRHSWMTKFRIFW